MCCYALYIVGNVHVQTAIPTRKSGSSVMRPPTLCSDHPQNTGFDRATTHTLCSDHPQNTGYFRTPTGHPCSGHPCNTGFHRRPPTPYAATTLRIPGSSVLRPATHAAGTPAIPGFIGRPPNLCSDHPQNTGYFRTATTHPGSDHPQERQLYSSVQVIYLAVVMGPPFGVRSVDDARGMTALREWVG